MMFLNGHIYAAFSTEDGTKKKSQRGDANRYINIWSSLSVA